MALTQMCITFFGTEDLYEVLSIPKSATLEEVKKAYHRKSLLVHPDRVDEHSKKEATSRFQTLGKVYAILSNEETRAVYDATGSIDAENESWNQQNWTDYWHNVFPSFTPQDITDYLLTYRGSEEEKKDIKMYYERFKGDMNKMSEYMPGYGGDQEDRYREIITNLIKNKEVQPEAKFMNESKQSILKRKRKFLKEMAAAEKASKKIKMDSSNSTLAIDIQNRRQCREMSFQSMISNLEAKYSRRTSRPGRKKK